jgi:predicted  nucleic acid-binding Zn-ribbon protein
MAVDPAAIATAQVANSVFSCSCTKDAAGPFCSACKAARRDDCVCDGRPKASPPAPASNAAAQPSLIQCPTLAKALDPIKAGEALEAIKADIKRIRETQTAYDTKLNKASAAIRDFEASKRDCKATLSELMSEVEMDQAKQNHDKLQETSACTLSGLRKDIEVLKRGNLTSPRIANQLTEVNGLIKDIEPLRFAMVDAQTRSTSMKADVRSITSQCK